MTKRRYSKYFSVSFLLVDLVFLNLGFLIANYIRFGQFWFQGDRYPFLFLFLNLTWTVIFFVTRLNTIDREDKLIDSLSQVLFAISINLAAVFAMWVSTRAYFYSREHLFYTYLIFSGLAILWRIGFINLIRYYRRCLLYTSPSPRDLSTSRMPSSA